MNTKDLPYEKGAQTLNLIENPGKKFITPFYYGIVDGDHDLNTTDDRLLYLVLFDQTEPIRFAMWNFIKNEAGDPDPHSPAWDWQYVIRDPEVGKRYSYRARGPAVQGCRTDLEGVSSLGQVFGNRTA